MLHRLKNRFEGAVKVYEKMLRAQPDEYKTHLSWIDISPESVRRAMLEVRRWNVGKIDEFERRLREAEKELHPSKGNPN
ncbi:MAG: hypothetical protein SCH71_12710 [Desulfobulbaceae bacterium]|nr:hypothetical protein [Desulfobulbaceae bacterium]